jgi:hypothetical protein
MKEQKLIEMSNKVETLGQLVTMLLNEVNNLKILSFGNNNTMKLMPGYEEAIEQLKEKSKAETENVE